MSIGAILRFMAKPRSDERPGLIGPPPEHVRVTVTVLPHRGGAAVRRRLGRMPIRGRNPLSLGVVAIAVVIVAVGIAALLGGVGETAGSEQGHQGFRGAAASTARCLSALAAADRRSARDDFDRAVWCERYAGRATAGSYRFVGGPLPVFDSTGR